MTHPLSLGFHLGYHFKHNPTLLISKETPLGTSELPYIRTSILNFFNVSTEKRDCTFTCMVVYHLKSMKKHFVCIILEIEHCEGIFMKFSNIKAIFNNILAFLALPHRSLSRSINKSDQGTRLSKFS